MGKNQDRGNNGQLQLAQYLRYHKIPVSTMPYNCSYDLQVKDCRIEIKTAALREVSSTGYGWSFNIHRHGVIKNDCDIYVFILHEVPHTHYSIYLLFPAPIDKTVIEIGVKDFFQGRYLKQAEAFSEWVKNLKLTVS